MGPRGAHLEFGGGGSVEGCVYGKVCSIAVSPLREEIGSTKAVVGEGGITYSSGMVDIGVLVVSRW